jgi:hypothetical protein
MSLSRLLTKSRLADARTCQRLHHMKYGLGYRPKARARALDFGILTGEGLDGIWGAKRFGIPELPPEASDEERYERGKLWAMLLGYQIRWQAEDQEKYEVLGCEVEFRCPLINPETGRKSETWELGGKLDKLVRERATGDVWIVEHKTSGEDISAGSSYWARLRMDTQVSIYHVGGNSVLRGRGLKGSVVGVVYDVLGKPKLRPLEVNTRRERAESPDEYEARCVAAIAESPDRYYRRAPVIRLEGELDDALVDIWDQSKQMREAELANRAPRNPEACNRWGRMCEFFPVCAGEATLQDETLYRLGSNVHPELTGQSAPREGAEVENGTTAAKTNTDTSTTEAPVKDGSGFSDQGQAAAPNSSDALRS